MSDDDKATDRVDEKLLVLPLGEESKLITQTIANDTARQILELLAEGAMSTSAIAKKLDIPLTTAQYNIEKLIEAKLVVVEKTKYSEKGREVKLYAPAKRMIVLVPANTPRQAVMDVLRKYLAFVPVAAVLALFVELAMDLRDGVLSFGGKAASNAGETAPSLTSQDGNMTSFAAAGSNGIVASATPFPLPAPTAMPTAAPPSGAVYSWLGNVSGSISGKGTDNLTIGLNSTTDLHNATAPVTGNMADAINRTADLAQGAGPAPLDTNAPAASAHSLIPADLLNHYGLWFFIGCLLIIGLMVAYDMYRVRSKKK